MQIRKIIAYVDYHYHTRKKMKTSEKDENLRKEI